jgi:carboxyl-terminal processing protease
MVNFVFEQLDKNRMTFKGLSFAQFKGEMDKTNLYYNAFKKPSNRLDIDLSKNKAIVKRYLAAEFARQLYGERIITKLF